MSGRAALVPVAHCRRSKHGAGGTDDPAPVTDSVAAPGVERALLTRFFVR